MRLETTPSGDVADHAALAMAERIRAACDEQGRCGIAFSGGSSPAPMFRGLAELDLPWPNVHVFQVDERAAPRGHTNRNLTLIEREFIDRIPGDRPRLHPMPVDGDLDAGAADYEVDLVTTCGDPPVLDVVHLGLGEDGHTASLVPGDLVLEVSDRWVATTGPYDGYRRMTLTYPTLEQALSVVFLVEGAEKASALEGLLAADPSLPAGRLQLRDAVAFADVAAAGEKRV